jgi:hypothetical protein
VGMNSSSLAGISMFSTGRANLARRFGDKDQGGAPFVGICDSLDRSRVVLPRTIWIRTQDSVFAIFIEEKSRNYPENRASRANASS